MLRVLAFVVTMLTASLSAASNLYFASSPSLSSNGAEIYFSYGGDIYKVNREGGMALMVVSMGGVESAPKPSPDGKFLAFSSNVQGNNNVYVVPVNGGDVKQLTFHDANDVPISWSPDSKYIYFESNRYNNISAYRVSIKGGTPERLFSHYFNTVANLVENPVTGEYYFNQSTESYRFATRKGYRGDHNPDINSWNPNTKEYKVLTQYRGRDLWPMVDVKGNLYYVSDQDNGEANIVRASDKATITDFEESIQYPSISADGSYIVFIKGYQIHLLETSTLNVFTPQIEVAKTPLMGDIKVNANRPESFVVSRDGKKLAFTYRGMIFVSDMEGNFVTPIPTPQNEKVEDIVWASDNISLYYTRTNRGFTNIYSQRADAPGNEREIYTPQESVKSFWGSNKGDKIVFILGGHSLMLLKTQDNSVEKLVDHEFWAFRRYRILFSPNDRYITYNAVNMFENDVFIYDLEKRESLNITNSANVESDPIFSHNGKDLYFVANRTGTSFPRGTSMRLYKVPLYKSAAPFATAEYSKLFRKDTLSESSNLPDSFDLEDIQHRYTAVMRSGAQNTPFVTSMGSRNFLLFNSNHEGSFGLYVQEIKDWDSKPPQKVKGVEAVMGLTSGGKEVVGSDRSSLYKINPLTATATKINISHSFAKSLNKEFEQMFYEVWALLEQNFYDVDFHGIDWREKREYYASFLPMVSNRADLRTLLNDMLNEVNSSHMGFTSRGSEESTPTLYSTAATGLLFKEKEPYIIERIVKGSPADYWDNPLRAGDRLVSVNGIEVDSMVNREFYFVGASMPKELSLVFSRKGEKVEVTMHTFSTPQLRSLLYTEWEDINRERTQKLSHGEVAYVHMRDMSNASLEKFLIDMHTHAVHKKALLLDLRYNNGGNVHKEVIDFLAAREHFRWSHKDNPISTHPNVTPSDKPIVVLINERSLSDAEITSNGIKSLSLATLVGTETYRWVIFTTSAQLVDGSSLRIPAWGCYTLEGKDIEFEGVSPHIYIRNTFEDRLYLRDPQLERGVEEALRQLR